MSVHSCSLKSWLTSGFALWDSAFLAHVIPLMFFQGGKAAG
jgi:hypothetical protein